MSGDDTETRKRSFWRELPVLVLVAVVIAVVVRTFFLQTFYIPSQSMENTLLVNDRVLVNKVVYDLREPRRGEVVVFRPPVSWRAGPDDADFIKRVVGVAGDRVVCCDAEGRVTVNGRPIDEAYLYPGNAPSDDEFDITVPPGRLFMMGDHRELSGDSRKHLEDSAGTVDEDEVVGRAFLVFWPLGRTDTLPVPSTYEAIPAGRG